MSNQKLIIEYQQLCQTAVIRYDTDQLPILTALQTIYDELLHEHSYRQRIWARLRRPRTVKGLYVWGGVGIGKTFLIDLFYKSLPFPHKLRMHFHAFVRMIHHELKALQGKANPLQLLAKQIAKKYLVICFDEFFVNDITDAMLLGKLLQALFAAGVTLVTTSNIEPDRLYEKGLQRPLFLPAITLLKQNCHIVHAQSLTDYRLQHLREAGVYQFPHNAQAQAELTRSFEFFAQQQTLVQGSILIQGRQITVIKAAETIAWFDFQSLCQTSRSKMDYLQLAQQYSTLIISNIPAIAALQKDVLTRFISLIDILYDNHCRLICSAAVSLENIYAAGPMHSTFARTLSRLQEMLSWDYFAKDLE